MVDKRRVVITGIGAITPLGHDVASTWKGLCESRSGVAKITLFDASSFPTKIAGEVKNFDFAKYAAGDELLAQAGRHSKFAIAAADEAMRDSGILGTKWVPERFGIYFGAGDGGCDFDNFVSLLNYSWEGEGTTGEIISERYIERSAKILSLYTELEQEPCLAPGHIARKFKLRGPVFNCLTACAASSQAIGEAYEIIRRGDADIMLSGGSHSMIHPFGVVGFNLLTALSTRNEHPEKASCPFDRRRDGFVLSEGSGVVILEELEHARKRGAKIYGELVGYGSTGDAYRLTDTHPEGRGAIKAIELALKDAGLAPSSIDYINAHGTSTSVNDTVETLAIKKVFGDYAKKVPVSSIKSMLGHLIAAAGAVEIIACLLAFRDDIIPPTINYEEPDPECDLDYVPNKARKARINTALSNSFGFGGQNISLIVKRFG